jgi:hypothetical protein
VGVGKMALVSRLFAQPADFGRLWVEAVEYIAAVIFPAG